MIVALISAIPSSILAVTALLRGWQHQKRTDSRLNQIHTEMGKAAEAARWAKERIAVMESISKKYPQGPH